VIDCRPHRAPRARGTIDWTELTDQKISAIPLLTALRTGEQ
jgi:5-formyltetrahydrofolate cyclo-ligase